jgi:hypothetical protein
MRADPARHTRYAAKVLLKYHLMEVRSQPLAPLRAWFAETPYLRQAWRRLGHPAGSLAGWCDALLAELAAGGALALRDAVAHDAV